MPKRGNDGRFTADATEGQQVEGFLHELTTFIALGYRFWRFLPLGFLIVVFWKYLQISAKIEVVFIELMCGSGCTCTCKAKSGL
jgi:hypothetical protein